MQGDRLTISRKEREQKAILTSVAEGKISLQEASKKLRLRQL